MALRELALRCLASAIAGSLVLAAPCPALAKVARGGLDGPIGTLHRGDYICEEAGDAAGEAGVHQPQADFTILHDSVYRSAAGQGSYLLTGQLALMTSGPKSGERFRRLSDGFLRRLTADGTETSLRCIRLVLNNQH